MEGLDESETLANVEGSIELFVECRLLRASSVDLHALTCVESATPQGKRGYAIAMKPDVARGILYASSDPQLSIVVRVGDKRLTLFRGYIDQMIPVQIESTGEKLVDIRGGDSLTGTRNLVSGLYNGLANFDTSLLFFSIYAEPTQLLGHEPDLPNLPHLESFLNEELPSSRCEEFREWLRGCESRGGSVGTVAKEFLRVVSLDHPMFSTAPFSFRNLAILAHNNASLWMAIGAVHGLRMKGIIRIGHAVVICEPSELHIWLKDRPRNEPLCRSWDSEDSLLITFFTADNSSETQNRGMQRIQRAFDLLQLAVSDSWFEHSDGLGGQVFLPVDGRLQDATLTLSRWIHVQHIPSGTAHQYYSGRQRSSHELQVTDFQADVIRHRFDILTDLLNESFVDRPKSYAHIDHAISWFSRSRNSVTLSERFLCLWISIEFLLIKTDEEAGREVIEAGVSSRVARLMGSGDRDRRKYWQRKAEEAYRLRCDLVHRAADDHERIDSLLPFLEQSVFEAIWHCTVNGQKYPDIEHPRDVFDQTTSQR